MRLAPCSLSREAPLGRWPAWNPSVSLGSRWAALVRSLFRCTAYLTTGRVSVAEGATAGYVGVMPWIYGQAVIALREAMGRSSCSVSAARSTEVPLRGRHSSLGPST
jgi:hypothetical protein